MTAQSLLNSLNKLNVIEDEIYFCGGGVHNKYLLERISRGLNKKCKTTQEIGVDPDYLEAICFAWLAKKRLDEVKFELEEITGSKGAVYLGRIFSPLYRERLSTSTSSGSIWIRDNKLGPS